MLLALVATIGLTVAPPAPTATVPNTTTQTTTTATQPADPSTNTQSTAPAPASAIDPRAVEELRHEVARLQEKVKTQNDLLGVLMTAVGVFLAVSTGYSIVGFHKSERRAEQVHAVSLDLSQKAEGRAADLHVQALQAAQVADGRSDEAHSAWRDSRSQSANIFQDSQRTLNLVNETLKLATEATSRASRVIEVKLSNTMKELDRHCALLIDRSNAYDDDKLLTQNLDVCSDIHRLGRKVEGLENNLVVLDHEIDIAPHCTFIRGADAYLNEQFAEAIEYWQHTTFHKDAPDRLRSLCHYWIGYVHNNIGEFHTAISDFRRALDLATGSRRFEINRIQLETQFFNKERASDVASDIQHVANTIGEELKANPNNRELQRRKIRTLTTLGNIQHHLGTTAAADSEERRRWFEQARESFHTVITHQKDKWALFGYAEALFELGKRDEAIRILRDDVKRQAENEFLNREEKRTKVLAKTTVLICCIRAGEHEGVVDSLNAVRATLGTVDLRLTIYSQLQRRNVKREEFLLDLERLMAEYEAGRSAAATVR